MQNAGIQIILIKSSSVLSALIHLIDLDLHGSTSKLTWAFGHINQSISKLRTLQSKNPGFIWFNFYLDFIHLKVTMLIP